MDNFEEMGMMFLIIMGYMVLNEQNTRRKRRWWVSDLNVSRDVDGYFESVYRSIKNCDEEAFFKHTRMTRAKYDLLLSMLEDSLTKTSRRKPISGECRLALTLLYLSQGVSHTFLGCTFKMGRTTVRQIILETCDIIWRCLTKMYVSEPSLEHYEMIAKDFESIWDLPNCIGAIDGKHVTIQNPSKSGSSSDSFVLLAVCDARYCFTVVDIGAYGTEGGILANSEFGKRLVRGELPLPPASILPGTNNTFPYYFVGDAAFPLKQNIMRPYPGKSLSREKKVFNYRISRARVLIENSFGILVARWRVLRSHLSCFPENAEKIVLATIALHNFIIINERNSSAYCPPSFVDHEDENGVLVPGLWRQEVEKTNIFTPARMGSNNAARTVFELRDVLKDYCSNEGAIANQSKIT